MSNLVIMKDKQVVTSSLEVADTFEKNHQHVLRDLDGLKEGVQNWTDLFWEDTYIHPQNKQPYRMIYMNRDGFTLLAMGFTGKKALQFKLEYIKAFNEMESQQAPASYMIADPIARAKQWIEEQQQTQLLIEKNAVQEQLIAEYEPKITYLDEILNSKNTMAITQIAADYGMSAIELNRVLAFHGVQRKVGGQWVLLTKHMNNGYTKSKTYTNDTGAYPRTKWTQKGRIFIHNLLESLGHTALVDEQIEIEV